MIHITPNYVSIQAARDIAKPWIEMWSGDEWGESMEALHSACKTSYGLDDEDCATIVRIMWSNLISMKEMEDEYHYHGEELTEETEAEARASRDYWLKGGNLGSSCSSMDDITQTIESIPAWVFGEEA